MQRIAKAEAAADALGPRMPEPEFSDDVVEIVEADDGSILDVVRRVSSDRI